MQRLYEHAESHHYFEKHGIVEKCCEIRAVKDWATIRSLSHIRHINMRPVLSKEVERHRHIAFAGNWQRVEVIHTQPPDWIEVDATSLAEEQL